jgi:hypothetical protein
VPRYLGTLNLIVSANACGTFTINFFPTVTYIADPDNVIAGKPTFEPLLLTVSDCARQLLSCNPNHCNIDARIAHDPLLFAAKKNTDRIQMTFSKPTTGMVATDFEVTLLPVVSGESRTISSVTPDLVDPKITTVVFSQRIPQTRWTCIRDKGSNKRCCMGSLPADVDDNRTSQYADTYAIWRNLDGPVSPALAIEKCDTDRSVQCSPADVLMTVDLLTGADAVPPPGVNGNSLPPFFVPAQPNYDCPNMRLPP